MLRTVALLLLAANLAFFAWTQGWLTAIVGIDPQGDREPGRLTSQVNVDGVRLWPAGVSATPAADLASGPAGNPAADAAQHSALPASEAGSAAATSATTAATTAATAAATTTAPATTQTPAQIATPSPANGREGAGNPPASATGAERQAKAAPAKPATATKAGAAARR